MILDLVSSTGVEIQIEGEGHGKLQVLVVVYSTFSDVTGGQVLSCQRQQSYVYDENRVIFYKYGKSSSAKTYTLTKEQHPIFTWPRSYMIATLDDSKPPSTVWLMWNCGTT